MLEQLEVVKDFRCSVEEIGIMEWKIGMKVETLSEDKGFSSAWSEGIVKAISSSSNGSVFFDIQYDKFVTPDRKPLVEKVPLDNIRPVPPQTELPVPFSEGLFVEAYDTDCWWRGFVVGKLAENEELWLVSFPDTKTFKSYPVSAFRLAQNWGGGGKWTLVKRV